MAETGQVIPLTEAISAPPSPNFGAARAQLARLLIDHTLIQSYRRCRRAGQPYGFADQNALLPEHLSGGLERAYQNTALLFAVDGRLPGGLNKHFRLRASNRVSWRNLQRFAPVLDLSEYKSADGRFDSPALEDLVRKLLPLDYALMVERVADGDGDGDEIFELTHFHVKVERLTDNAIKDLGRSLGYIERRLFERGEDYVEALETKFYEYHGFSANASGRKSAGAMAAQLLAASELDFAVFVASQEDNRLTVLTPGDVVVQYLLIRLSGRARQRFEASIPAGATLGDYLVNAPDGPDAVLILRAELARAAAALPRRRRPRDKDIVASWLTLAEEVVIPLPAEAAPAIPIAWSEERVRG